MKCTTCGVEGYAGPSVLPGEDPIEIILSRIDFLKGDDTFLLQRDDNYYCFPCLSRVDNICVYCRETVDQLHKEPRCTTGSWVCKDCLNQQISAHRFECYGNGCMSPGDVAEESQAIMRMDGEL